MTSPSFSNLEFVVQTIARTAVENEKYFGELDSVVGDGDFGFSLARGFEIVLTDWDSYPREDIGAFLQKIAMAITGRIGGTSGPIWGTAFLRAAANTKGRNEIEGGDVVIMLRAAMAGIKARGKAELGDKTLLDALDPMTNAIEAGLAAGSSAAEIAAAAAVSARTAADETAGLRARRGRASYTGERSIGSVDPGAIAVAVVAEKVAANWPTRT